MLAGRMPSWDRLAGSTMPTGTRASQRECRWRPGGSSAGFSERTSTGGRDDDQAAVERFGHPAVPRIGPSIGRASVIVRPPTKVLLFPATGRGLGHRVTLSSEPNLVQKPFTQES